MPDPAGQTISAPSSTRWSSTRRHARRRRREYHSGEIWGGRRSLRSRPGTLGGKLAKILVIEGDLSFLELVRVHLAGAGHEVVTAEDAALGLRAIIGEVPDLIVLDIFVPYLDGFELLKAGRTDDETYARARKLGVADFFTKPVERDQLIRSIERLLAPRRTDPGAR